MAISTFLQQLESELAGKPEALAVVEQYRPALEQADTQKNKDGLILLQGQMHAALAVALSAPVDPAGDSSDSPARGAPQPTFAFDMALAGFMARINAIMNLSLSKNEKLRQMIDGYALSAAIAQELDPRIQIKPIKEALEALLQLGTEKLSEIAQFEKPTLIITPESSFNQKQNGMGAYRKYERQADVGVWTDRGSPFESVGSPTKMRISIVDGAQHMPHIQGISSDLRFDRRRAKFKEHYQKKGMRLINIHEYVTLMQRSLEEYRQSGTNEASRDTSKILDFYSDGNDTITCLDDEYLSPSPSVAYGFFSSNGRRVSFRAVDPDNASAGLRGRPSVQVMEY